jgi:hypothetical protein
MYSLMDYKAPIMGLALPVMGDTWPVGTADFSLDKAPSMADH